MEYLGDILGWVKWLGIGGLAAGLALIIFAPSLARVAADFLSPIFRAGGELVVWFVRDVLWEGIKDMTDNLASVVTVACLVLLGGYMLSTKCDPKPAVDKAIADLRLNYKFVERTPAEKRAQMRKQNQAAPCWYCLW